MDSFDENKLEIIIAIHELIILVKEKNMQTQISKALLNGMWRAY